MRKHARNVQNNKNRKTGKSEILFSSPVKASFAPGSLVDISLLDT